MTFVNRCYLDNTLETYIFQASQTFVHDDRLTTLSKSKEIIQINVLLPTQQLVLFQPVG